MPTGDNDPQGQTPPPAPPYPFAPLQLRPSVAAFAQLMEHTLRRHDPVKGGQANWREAQIPDLFCYLEGEVKELQLEIYPPTMEQEPDDDRVVSEAVDVANLAMMIADRARDTLALDPSTWPPAQELPDPMALIEQHVRMVHNDGDARFDPSKAEELLAGIAKAFETMNDTLANKQIDPLQRRVYFGMRIVEGPGGVPTVETTGDVGGLNKDSAARVGAMAVCAAANGARQMVSFGLTPPAAGMMWLQVQSHIKEYDAGGAIRETEVLRKLL